MRAFLVGAFGALCLLAQDSPISLNRVVTGVNSPTDIQHAGDGTGRLFLVQQTGIIRILSDGALAAAPFLDIRGRVRSGGERGLLGLAFPPDYANKQHFYVNYTNQAGDTVIARYRTTANPDTADPNSETILLTIGQPFANHNGGQLRFGPDGLLYIGTGDGGSGGDPMNNAQNPSSLLGKMLRIDVESDLNRILVPPDNPFVNDPAFRPEIWAIGLRNPWRYSFDRATADLWIADVGQNRAEEVNYQPASSPGGENYGWRLMEGLQCFVPGCNTQGLTLPILEYTRADGCSVTGGFVYRGIASPGLRGTYLYGDFCSGRIWGVRKEGNGWTNQLLLDSDLGISTFGEDEAGEVYVADLSTGEIYRIGGSQAPAFTASSVVNAASFLNGIVAGSAATVFAAGVRDAEGITAASEIPLPLALDGVSVTVDGIVAPLFAVTNVNGVEQVNFQVPFEVEGRQAVSIVVTRDGNSSAAVQAQALATQPGVFTLNGRDAIVVHHADNTLVTAEKPLERGEFAYFYATGLGPVENNPGTGNAGPRDPLAHTMFAAQVTLGGVPCEVLFTGLAPDFVAVYQINIRVAPDAPTGEADLVLSVNGASSPATKVPVQ